jgi:hypothetical protein
MAELTKLNYIHNFLHEKLNIEKVKPSARMGGKPRVLKKDSRVALVIGRSTVLFSTKKLT